MRKEFSAIIEKEASKNKKILFLTGDLGFMALENIQNAIEERFINVGVSEQNMVSIAAGLAYEGLLPICYSIAPFMIFRPAEQIRLDVCLHNMNVKIVGNGGGYGYGIMGATHHAIEDIAMLSSFQNIKCYIPFCNEDVENVVLELLEYQGPSYLRLGFGPAPKEFQIPFYNHTRKIISGQKVTVVGLGPVILNLLNVSSEIEINLLDIFVISEIPIPEISQDLKESIIKTKRLIIIEEHVKRGGLGEHLALALMEENINCTIIHHHAKGYPNGLYGSQTYHQQINNLDSESLLNSIKRILNV